MSQQQDTYSNKPSQITFLTVKELASLLKVSRRSVYNWAEDSKRTGFPVERIGGLIRFRLDKVLKWMDETN